MSFSVDDEAAPPCSAAAVSARFVSSTQSCQKTKNKETKKKHNRHQGKREPREVPGGRGRGQEMARGQVGRYLGVRGLLARRGEHFQATQPKVCQLTLQSDARNEWSAYG